MSLRGSADTIDSMTTTDAVEAWPQGPARTPTDGPLTFEELQLAGRNRGMPLEALRYDITPTGLHYLLVHFDIPAVDAATWRLRLDGLVDRPIELGLDEIRARPRRTVPVTLFWLSSISACSIRRSGLNQKPL